MAYRIVVEKTEQVSMITGREWAVVGQIEKTRERGMFSSVGNEPKTYLAEEYGYTPEITKTVEITTKVYEQTVEYLSLDAVICAVNQIIPAPADAITGEDKPF